MWFVLLFKYSQLGRFWRSKFQNPPRVRSYPLIHRKLDLEEDLASLDISFEYLGIVGTLLLLLKVVFSEYTVC